MRGLKEESDDQIDKLPTDILSHIFLFISSLPDLAQASSVSKKWREGAKQSLGIRERLDFSGCTIDDASTASLVHLAFSLKELDISRSRSGCQITDNGLFEMSTTKCVENLTSISLRGMTGITDKGVVQLVSRATSLQHLNIGGTFITAETLFAIGNNCLHLKSVDLRSCRRVSDMGLHVLVNKCKRLESIDVWGVGISLGCFISLMTINPVLQIYYIRTRRKGATLC